MDRARASLLSDETLMQRYARGDAGAFDQLFERYQARVYAFFLRGTRSEDRAADLYQRLFLRLHRARASYDSERAFAPWFFQIARRLLVDEFRHDGRVRDLPLPGVVEHACAGGPDPEAQLAAAERVGQLLDQLGDLERHVIVSAKVEGREYVEIASEIDKSVAAVKKLASRAMRRLRPDGIALARLSRIS